MDRASSDAPDAGDHPSDPGFPVSGDPNYLPTPPDLYGRRERDRLLRVLGVAGRYWFPAWQRLIHPGEPQEVDRSFEVRVVDRRVVARDENVIALTFGPVGDDPLPRWYAGAHLDLLLPSGRMREYSLCGDPTVQDTYRIAVRRIPDGGGGSIEVHDTLKVGDTIRIKGPRNAFPLSLPGFGSPATRMRFVAGGIGITPILPMLATAERLELPWSMIYVGRSRESLPFLDELRPYGNKITIRTDDEHGLPTPADLLGDEDSGTPSDEPSTVYTCGPPMMLENLRQALVGRPDVELHYERFSAPPVVGGRPFTVTLAKSGVRVPVAADEPALEAIRRELPGVPYSCRQGFCGTCKIKVLDGKVEHRDTILSDAERDAGSMLICVSRCIDDELTLDL